MYALVAGSLSDRFGRGPLLVLPIIGQILEGAALLVNKVQSKVQCDYLRSRFSSYSLQVWFAELPLEALWLANIYDVLGGSAVWYLGVCSFAADITAAEERASRIARFGGAEQLAFILGNALSPVLFNAGGYELAFR